MFGLAKLLEALVGPYFKVIVLPVILLALLTTSHLLVEGWKDRLRHQGETICNGQWESKIRDEERARAAQALSASREILAAEQRTNQELSDENEKIAGELQAVLAGSSGDGSCLSPGVLDALRGEKPQRLKPSS